VPASPPDRHFDGPGRPEETRESNGSARKNKNAPPERGVRTLDALKEAQCFFVVVFVSVVVEAAVVVPVAPVAAIMPVPPVIPVADVSVVAVMPVADVSVVAAVVVVAPVSDDEVVLDTAVSVAAVSVFALSSFLQPKAKSTRARIEIRTIVFFISMISPVGAKR
jgi:hypothetical protein